MEKGHNIDAPALMRRKRKVARQQREKTPEPSKVGTSTGTGTDKKKASDEESSSTVDYGVQTITMQIRPPGSLSAHKSKILSRRNKSFTGAAVRSSSAPRERESGDMGMRMTTSDVSDSPDVMHLLRYARRSLSSPRHKEDSSESGRSSPPNRKSSPQPPPPPRMQRPVGLQSTDDERLSRLERNLQRFEQERRKFEIEKLLFEREKRELHKIRYRQLEREDRKKLVESYRRFNEHFNLPSDSDEKPKLSQSFRETRIPSPKRKIQSRAPDYDSSTASSAADSSDDLRKNFCHEDFMEQNNKNLNRHSFSHSPHRKPIEKPYEPPTETIRERKIITSTEVKPTEIKSVEEISVSAPQNLEKNKQNQNFISKIFLVFSRKEPVKEHKKEKQILEEHSIDTSKLDNEKLLSLSFMRFAWKECRQEWIKTKADYPQEISKIRILWSKCLAHLIILALFCGFGGLIFRFVEGSWENSYKCEIRKVKREFIDHLWVKSHNLREDDWKSEARNKLRQFEEGLQTAFEAGITSYSGIKAWSFVNSVMFCLTVVTSIGYGHIAPKTTLGRGITIIYAIIGIPMFLILLADFGKLFTRMMKFVWAYIRRLYYTGTCRKVRKQQQVKDVMRGMYTVYDFAIRRPSTYIIGDVEAGEENHSKELGTNQAATPLSVIPSVHSNTDGPPTPYPETIEIDDEFNLPISVATTILLIYIFAGASVYVMWEDWSYFESFYFVFISMSTIGFGDFVPNHPIFMMCSIIYLIFGLALTSMFINVVQIKLSDSFKQASAKISATIGFSSETGVDNSSLQNQIQPDTSNSGTKLENIPETAEIQENHNSTVTSNQNTNGNDENLPPPLPSRKSSNHQVIEKNEKNKRTFF